MRKPHTACVILAAGYGSRIKGYSGNKTLLPLLPESGPYKGRHSILLEVLRNLPAGPKAVVVHHEKEEVIGATRDLGVFYCEQRTLNGTGGALMAAQSFLEGIEQENLLITMGDTPFVKAATYRSLLRQLRKQDFVVLGFRPTDRAQYGLLEIEDETVKRIIEWKYWSEYPSERKSCLEICNSGIYATKRGLLLEYLNRLRHLAHHVEKVRENKTVVVEEYFITDIVELLNDDGLKVGVSLAREEHEVMGIDTDEDLVVAQEIFARRS
jgi:bifunctional UDP-N-acetylglucosamine pyrophosphorylase/glucosamine-1-phosphate N-acetyltransferase